MDTRTLQAIPIGRVASLTPVVEARSNVPDAVRVPARTVLFAAGLVTAGTGVAALLRADLGTGPGDVMIGAMAAQIGVSHGTAAQALATAFIIVAMLLGRRPGPGTIATAALLGPIINVALAVLPFPGSFAARVAFAAIGMIAMGVGVGVAIGARFGPSTGELWADAVAARLGADKQTVRLSLEATLVVLGIALGGPVGIVTLVIGFTIGPLIDLGTRIARQVSGASARQWERSVLRFSRF
ncbi:MAG: hypothetical protein R3249_00700 [Nitriliruptorales bacterium]|nr:hypothetical protein [Nitriliruptorales bacterium]